MRIPSHSVWKDPGDAEDEDGIPQLAGDSSDDELGEVDGMGGLGSQEHNLGDMRGFENFHGEEDDRFNSESGISSFVPIGDNERPTEGDEWSTDW